MVQYTGPSVVLWRYEFNFNNPPVDAPASGKHYPNEHVFLEGSLLVSPLKMGCRFRPLAVSYQRVDLAHVSEL